MKNFFALNQILKRGIALSLVLSMVFPFPQSGNAEPPPSSPSKSIPSILTQLPVEYGKVKAFSELTREANGAWFIHIQDAHANPGAQQNIAKILEYLAGSFPEMTVAVEGAGGELHPEYFDFFPDFPEAGEAVVQDLLEKGEMSGAELFAWKQYRQRQGRESGEKIKVLGVEDPDAYRRNAEAYRSYLLNKDEIEKRIGKVYEKIFSEASTQVNPTLKTFIREKHRRKEGRFNAGQTGGEADWTAYLGYLQGIVKKELKIDLDDSVEQIRFPNLVRFRLLQKAGPDFQQEEIVLEWRQALQQMDAWDKEPAEKEMVEAVRRLAETKVFAQKTGAAVSSVRNEGHLRRVFEEMLQAASRHQSDITGLKRFMAAWRAWIFNEEINAEALDKEMTILEDWIVRNLAQNEEELEWLRKLEDVQLLDKACRLELIREEEEEARSRRERLEALAAGGLEPALQNGFQFYETARLRDSILVNKAFESEENQKISGNQLIVLITGGFHTDGIQQELRERGISSAVLMPSIQELDGGEHYQKVMAESYADLTGYFEVQNPFLTKQEALLFRELLEVAVPVLVKRYNVPASEISKRIKESMEKSPVLSGAVSAVLETQGDLAKISISVRNAGEPVSIAQNAVSGLLNSAPKTFAEAAGARPKKTGGVFLVEYAMTPNGPLIQMKNTMPPKSRRFQIGDVTVTSGKIPQGLVPGALINAAASFKTAKTGQSGRRATPNTNPLKRSEMRAVEKPKYKTDVADSGSFGTNNEAYFLQHTRPRITGAITEDRYTHIKYSYPASEDEEGDFSARPMTNASALDQTLREKLAAISKNEKLAKFLKDNKEELAQDGESSLNIYLLEADPESPEARHPLFLTAVGMDFSMAISDTRGGSQHAVYMTRQAFVELPTLLLVDILMNQISIAIIRKKEWSEEKPMKFLAYSEAMQKFAGRLRRNPTIKAAQKAFHRNDIKLREEKFVTEVQSRNVTASLLQLQLSMPDYPVAKILLHYGELFHQAVNRFDFKQALYAWGLLTYELRSLEFAAGDLELRGSDVQINASRFLTLAPLIAFRGLLNGITDSLKRYIELYGLSNEGGEEHGFTVGRVRVVENPEKLSEAFEEEARKRKEEGKKEDVIWIVPYLPVHYGEIPGEGLIISVGGNRHAIDTAKEQAIPLAVIPNAVQLLADFNEEKAVLRIDDDAEVRFRKAHEGETTIRREKEKYKIKIPPARTDGPLSFNLNDVDENFVSFVGPKAATLGKLKAAGIPVPDGVVLSFAFWKRFLDQNSELQTEIAHTWAEVKIEDGQIITPDPELQQILVTLKDFIRRAPFPEDLKEELRRITKEIFGKEFEGEELETLLDHIKGVFAAKYNLAPVQARVRHKIAEDAVMPAVLLQVPKAARVAGTLYTADTVSYNRNMVTIMASHGQGAAVVGERGQPAEVKVNKFTKAREVKQAASQMDKMYRVRDAAFFYVRSTFNFEDLQALRTAGFYDSYPDRSDASKPGSKLEIIHVPTETQNAELFSEELSGTLLDYAERIESLFDSRPQDIEWLQDDDNKVWIVQSRPQKTEKLPTELMLEDEIMAKIAQLDPGALASLKAAFNKGDAKSLLSSLQLEKEMRLQPLESIQRYVAASYLDLLLDQPDFLERVAEGEIKEVVESIARYFEENPRRLADLSGVLLLRMLRKSIAKIPEAKDSLRDLFSALASFMFPMHLVHFEVAKALVAFEDYPGAMKRIQMTKETALQDPGVADRSMRILEEIPLQFSGPLLEDYAANNKLPLWLQEYAGRVIERLERKETAPPPADSARSEMRTRISDLPLIPFTGATDEFRKYLAEQNHGDPFAGIPDFAASVPFIDKAARALGGIYDVTAVAIATSGNNSQTALAAAREWLEGKIAKISMEDNPEVMDSGLRDFVNQVFRMGQKNARGQAAPELGAEIHIQLPASPKNITAWMPVLAMLASLRGKIHLNVAGLSSREAETLRARFLDFAQNKGVRLGKNQFNVIGDDFFESVPKTRLDHTHGLLGQTVQNFQWQRGIQRFELDAEAMDQPEVLAVTILTVMRALALNKVPQDYALVLNPRKMEPDAFEALMGMMTNYLQAQAKLAASA